MDYIAQDILNGDQGNVVNLNWGRQLSATLPQGAFGYYEVVSNGVFPDLGFITQGKVGNTNVGLFFQDAWTINNKFTLNLGLRTENESVPSYSEDPNLPDPAHEFTFGDKLAPRVGFAWDISGDGKNKVYGNWGIFYDILKLELGLTLVRRRQVDLPLLHARHAELGHAGCRRLPARLPRQVPPHDRLPAPVERGHRPEHGPDEAAGVVVRLRA